MARYKTLFYTSLALNAAIILFISAKRVYYSRYDFAPSLKKQELIVQYNEVRNSIYESFAIDSNDIVLLGTSITEGIPAELLGSQFKNRGINGNTTGMMDKRINALLSAHPKDLILEAGINDFIVQNLSSGEVFEKIKKMVHDMQTLSAGTKITLQSLLPTSGEYKPYMPRIKELNAALRNFCNAEQIGWIELFDLMGGDGGLKFSIDGLHPNGEGYKVMAGKIKEYLALRRD